jgi:hypothetical protein
LIYSIEDSNDTLHIRLAAITAVSSVFKTAVGDGLFCFEVYAGCRFTVKFLKRKQAERALDDLLEAMRV